MEFTLRGESLSTTQADVIRVTRDVPPAPGDGRNKYFISLHGRNYPIKQVLRLLSGLPSASFTAQDAYRILACVGFDVFEDQARAAKRSRAIWRVCASTAPLHSLRPSSRSRYGCRAVARLPVISGDDFVRAVSRVGFAPDRMEGSHMILIGPAGRRLTVPRHRELGRGLLRALIRDAGLTRKAFLDLLYGGSRR